jgi:uncharacterized protein YjbI with pentapeptide repeats
VPRGLVGDPLDHDHAAAASGVAVRVDLVVTRALGKRHDGVGDVVAQRLVDRARCFGERNPHGDSLAPMWPVAPDIDEAELDPWSSAELATGFVLEDVLADGVSLGAVRAAGGRVARGALIGVEAAGSRLRSLSLTDVVVREGDFANVDLTGARLKRVVFERVRMTGVTLAEIEAEDVLLRGCRLDLAGFRAAQIARVAFDDCVLDEADFYGATLRQVRFAGSRMHGIEFEQAQLSGVDLRRSEVEDPRGELRGTIIDSVQLAGLAPLLAARLGIKVDDGG